ncbi:MAG: D-alanyl-D-alanine carboxypeptidase/D-alanyl-D-alanine-endopeptidase [Phycisphaerales bacterium]|nr:MAG: D-alanyl-D-alanine carboxypeptidase/D-alanyl-D-alanine-endopeptidase [Phycisphaerales bacterium]
MMERKEISRRRGTILHGWSVATLAWIALAGASISPAHAQSTVAQEIRSALSALPHPQTVLGACVIDMSSGSVIFEQDADKPLVPASNQKVFTMATALAVLGPEFEFTTTLATDGLNLFLVGDGDPALGDEKLCSARGESITAVFEEWADRLVQGGTQSIPGDLVIDESIFGDVRTHPTWEERDLDNWYAAPVGGLNFNNNCVDITIHPATAHGAPVLVTVEPPNSLAEFINKCETRAPAKPVLRHQHDTFQYLLSGTCNKKWSFGSVSFPKPGLLTADALRSVLANRGINLAGIIRRDRVRLPDGALPANLTIIGQHHTPLADVLNRAGKNSQNMFAECLIKRTGYAWAVQQGATDPAGSWELGSEAVLYTLRSAGIDVTELTIADGSGLSRYNWCTARQLTEVLAWIARKPGGRLFFDSLSIAGVDGSLKKRLKDMPGKVRGKTGTMRNIRTLSGYADRDGGGRYAFAMMFNGYKGPSTPYKEIQDRICRALVRGSR